jgi:DNA-binding NarL/FixJ family response regulator
MTKKIKIVLVEDNPEYRHVISLALEDDPIIELINQFGMAEPALRNLQNPAARQVPDIVLLDLNLPRMSGLEALPWFQKYAPKTKIIILTQSNKEADIFCAIQRGASGYLLKSAGIDDITEAIQSVANGEAALDPSLAKFILKVLCERPAKQSIPKELSSRELEILTLLGDGLIKKEIADHLQISVNTTATHIRHIYEKLQVPNAPAAIHRAHCLGLFSKKQ